MHVDKIKLNKKERKVMVARIWDSGILEASKVGGWEGVGVQEICAHIFFQIHSSKHQASVSFLKIIREWSFRMAA